MEIVTQLLVAGTLMGILDAVWLSVIAKGFYYSQVGALLRPKPDMAAALVFYVLYVIGIVVFALEPALSEGSWLGALGRGALFGLIAYATYDLTNRATLKTWPWRLVAVDIVWGTVLTALVSVGAYGIISTWLS